MGNCATGRKASSGLSACLNSQFDAMVVTDFGAAAMVGNGGSGGDNDDDSGEGRSGVRGDGMEETCSWMCKLEEGLKLVGS